MGIEQDLINFMQDLINIMAGANTSIALGVFLGQLIIAALPILIIIAVLMLFMRQMKGGDGGYNIKTRQQNTSYPVRML